MTLTAACGESNAVATARYDHVNPAAMKRLIGGGTQLRVFSREIMDACYTAAHAQYAEWSEKIPEFKKLGDSYFKYLETELEWFRVAEGTYDNYMSGRASRKK
jgi:TRAP-type mannitol/chloroaromatic compound transport system substrate-binding protein